MTPKVNARSVWEGRRTALVIAHPGHEMLVHHWMTQAKPLVFVLTTGSDEAGDGPFRETAKVVERCGATVGGVFGRFTDRGLQQALLLREKDRFNGVVQELADAFLHENIDVVAGDSAEGFDPAHDLCRFLVDAACDIAGRLRPTLRNFELPLFGGRLSRQPELHERMDDAAYQRKLDDYRSYAGGVGEVEQRLRRHGAESLRDECLRLATPWAIRTRRDVLYARPNNGVMPAVQFADHILPLAGSIHRYSGGRPTFAA